MWLVCTSHGGGEAIESTIVYCGGLLRMAGCLDGVIVRLRRRRNGVRELGVVYGAGSRSWLKLRRAVVTLDDFGVVLKLPNLC